MEATVVQFPDDRTFDHLDKNAVRLVDFLPKWSQFRQSLGGTIGDVLAPSSYCSINIEIPCLENDLSIAPIATMDSTNSAVSSIGLIQLPICQVIKKF